MYPCTVLSNAHVFHMIEQFGPSAVACQHPSAKSRRFWVKRQHVQAYFHTCTCMQMQCYLVFSQSFSDVRGDLGAASG